MAFWNLLFGRHAGIFSLNGMLTVFPDSDRVPNLQPSCAFPPQKIRFLAGKPLLVPTPAQTAGLELRNQWRHRLGGGIILLPWQPSKTKQLTLWTGFRNEQKGMSGRLFLEKNKPRSEISRAAVTRRPAEDALDDRLNTAEHFTIVAIANKTSFEQLYIKTKSSRVLTLFICVLCVEAECSDGQMCSLIHK